VVGSCGWWTRFFFFFFCFEILFIRTIDLLDEFLSSLVSLGVLSGKEQKVGMLLEWCLSNSGFSPEIRSEVSISGNDGIKSCFNGVSEGLGRSFR